MVNYIVAVRMSGGNAYQHISDVKWHEAGSILEKKCTRQAMAQAIENGADVRTPGTGIAPEARVRVIPGTTYLRTDADSLGWNNLLALPRF